MRRTEIMTKQIAVAVLVTMGVLGGVASLAAQGVAPPVLLMLDQTAFDYGDAPHLIPTAASNSAIAGVGLRETPAFFATRIGESVTLPGVDEGGAGWFALLQAPASWASNETEQDGLENFFSAGAGLGSPDDNDERTTLLTAVPGVVALQEAGLYGMVNRTVCAIIFDGQIAAATDPEEETNLAGANLGVASFEVTGVVIGPAGFPQVTVTVRDAKETCSGAITAMNVAQ
jgi:hypothetical protein